MRTDVKINTEDYNFKLRVSGLVTLNDKFLVVNMNDSTFFCLPGGHIELGETSDKAILREMEEELGYQVKIIKYLGVAENYFVNEQHQKIHEICFYYLLKPKNDIEENNYQRLEIDKGRQIKMDFQWITKKMIKEMNIKPTILKDWITNNNLEFNHCIINDLNEQ